MDVLDICLLGAGPWGSRGSDLALSDLDQRSEGDRSG